MAWWRPLIGLLALAAPTLGLLGSYSYGKDYWQHRGFAPVALLSNARLGRLLTVHFYSAALHRPSDYLVYLPPGYSRRSRYPVYYLLHGAPGSPQDFISVVNLDVRLSNRLSQHQLQPMILVMPDGRPGGSTFFDSEWANTPAGAFESYVLGVVRDVDSRFATIPSRQARVIAGYSAGGYGALNIALHHLAVFENVQSWSGYFVQSRECCLAFAHASPGDLAYNSPLDYARTLTRAELSRYPLRAYMFTGRTDRDGRQIVQMAAELRRVGAVANYDVLPGGHDWQVWYGQVDRMMLMASRMLSHPLRAPQRSRQLSGRSTRKAALVARAPSRPSGPSAPRARAARHGGGFDSRGWLGPRGWLGLLLAVASAALINLGFLLQQRGLVHALGDGVRAWLSALRSRTWLSGQGLGWLGFGGQIFAVAIAPLSLVQAFAAGGLALSVPLAAGIFGHRVPRIQMIAVAAVATSLAVLPVGVPHPGPGMATAALICATAAGLAAGAIVSSSTSPGARAIGAGVFYGVADAAIKAVALGLHTEGAAALLSGWTVVAALGTFGGFLAFQAALRRGNAISAISLMTALSTLTAVMFGLAVFRESLGSAPGTLALHLLAISAVLGCVPLLAAATPEERLSWRGAAGVCQRAMGRIARVAGASAAAGLALLVVVVAGTGLLYGMRGFGWLDAGPRLGDALPLLQLAGFDAQPLPRIAAAWLLAGAVFGLALIRVRPDRRVVIAAAGALFLLLFASDACFALARNLRLSDVLAARLPGAGAWIEGTLFGVGATLARPMPRQLRFPRRVIRARQLLSARAG
jgi:enterochelin esterase-like enzyme